MDRATPRRWALGCLPMAFAACVGGQTGEAPADTDGSECRANNSCRSFGEMLSGSGRGRYLPPADISEAVSKHEVIAAGTVVDLVEGRRVQLDDGSNPDFYAQYVDLVISPSEVFKGAIPVSTNIHVEFVWPRNAPIDELSAALPRGVRALVLGQRSEGMTEATPHTLLVVPPYGLAFERSDGAAVLPFEGDAPFQKIVPGAPESFADVHAAIAQVLQP